MNLTITVEDPGHPDAVQLIQHLSAELGERYGDDGSGAFKPADVQVPRSAFVVARLDDRAVGCGALRPYAMQDGEEVAEVKRMYVEADMRGRGISRQILLKLEELARGFGYRRLVLETGERQPEAIGLYEKSGFRRIPCYGRYAGQPWSICFEKKIG